MHKELMIMDERNVAISSTEGFLTTRDYKPRIVDILKTENKMEILEFYLNQGDQILFRKNKDEIKVFLNGIRNELMLLEENLNLLHNSDEDIIHEDNHILLFPEDQINEVHDKLLRKQKKTMKYIKEKTLR